MSGLRSTEALSTKTSRQQAGNESTFAQCPHLPGGGIFLLLQQFHKHFAGDFNPAELAHPLFTFALFI